jgi:hypothetical protein
LSRWPRRLFESQIRTRISLSAAAFDLAGHGVTHPFVFNTTVGTGTLFADASILMIDAQGLQVLATGRGRG